MCIKIDKKIRYKSIKRHIQVILDRKSRDAISCAIKSYQSQVSFQYSIGKYEIVITLSDIENSVKIYDEDGIVNYNNITDFILGCLPTYDDIYKEIEEEDMY